METFHQKILKFAYQHSHALGKLIEWKQHLNSRVDIVLESFPLAGETNLMETRLRHHLQRCATWGLSHSLGKLIEWKHPDRVYPPIAPLPLSHSLGKLIEWKLRPPVPRSDVRAFPLAGKLIEWKPASHPAKPLSPAFPTRWKTN